LIQKRHVHLIGIVGTAMASLAGLLKQQGYHVTGSDAAAYPPMSDLLRSMQIPVLEPYAETNLQPHPDIVIVGNAISRGNVELEYVLDHRIPMRSLPQMLHESFLAGREPIVVAGTHGKTTTTSMLAWMFEVAGKSPSFLIGGIAENFGTSFALRETEHFILEGDEYDTAFFDKGPKFLHYFPRAAILTSVEFDHADIYKDLDAVKTAFKRLVNLIPRIGYLIAYDNSPNVDECMVKAFCKVERYGRAEGSAWRIRDMDFGAKTTSWTVEREGKSWATLSMALAGEYNVLNATAAAAMATQYEVPLDAIRDALARFKSVKRRLEVKAEVAGITIIDDFAHHPTAIAETLKALRTRYKNRRLWTILEPRSNTLRRNVFFDDLVASLANADEIVVASVFKAEAIPEKERLSTDALVRELVRRGHRARECKDADEIVHSIAGELKDGDVVAILSNGGFGNIYEKLPTHLAKTKHDTDHRHVTDVTER
jgi:UDP-N-acetylmuramate: L-alanyl-gamma-D-glutamyl-meso-diaminopimelate ligase